MATYPTRNDSQKNPRRNDSQKNPRLKSSDRLTPLLKSGEASDRLKSSKQNPLHDFATYNCLFTLSGINEASLQSQKNLFEMPLTNVIARSAGIGTGEGLFTGVGPARDDEQETTLTGKVEVEIGGEWDPNYKDSIGILNRLHDIFFENVNITSVVGPNVERNLANFTKMTFELHEPYGITFIEKLRACAYLNNYLDYQAAPFLLTINFQGFDENGTTVVNGDVKSLERRIPIFITNVDFDVNEGGARYEVTAVPYQDMAFDDSYKFARTSIQVNADSVDDWIRLVEAGLVDQMRIEREEGAREFDDEYRFDISRIRDKLGQGTKVTTVERDSIFGLQTVLDWFETLKQKTVDRINDDFSDMDSDMNSGTASRAKMTLEQKNKGMNIDPNTSLVKAFEDIVRSSDYYQKLIDDFWGTYAEGETQQTLLKKFQDPKKLAEFLEENQYVDWFFIKPKIENLNEKGLDAVTKMYPKRITYQAIPYKVHIGKLVLPGLGLGDVDWSQYSRRNYNYIYTGDNVDIQNLRINYQTAYFYRNVRTDPKGVGTDGLFYNFKKGIRKWLGGKKQPEPTLPLRQYPSILKQRNLVQQVSPASLRANEFFDYLVNPVADMLNVEMEILGDPAYIAQDCFAPIADKVLQDGIFEDSRQSFNMESYMPVVTLTYRMPADIDDKQGNMFSDKYLDENLFFSGAYQVTKVESSMNQGEFRQTLTMVRMNNQKGSTAPKELIDSAQDGAKKIMSGDNIKKDFGPYFRT